MAVSRVYWMAVMFQLSMILLMHRMVGRYLIFVVDAVLLDNVSMSEGYTLTVHVISCS
jgi:hypothetical protein